MRLSDAISSAATDAEGATRDLFDSSDERILLADVLFSKCSALVEVGVGYGIYISLAVGSYFVYCLKYGANFDYELSSIVEVWATQARLMYHGVNTALKIKLLLLMYGFLVPLLLAILACRALARTLPESVRVEHFEGDGLNGVYIICLVVMFVFSHLFMAHVQFLAYEMRQMLRADLLLDVLPDSNMFEHDPEQHNLFNMQQRLMQLTFSRLLKKFLINFSMVVPCMIASVVIPLRFGQFLCPVSLLDSAFWTTSWSIVRGAVESVVTTGQVRHLLHVPALLLLGISTGLQPLQLRVRPIVLDVQIPVEMVLSACAAAAADRKATLQALHA